MDGEIVVKNWRLRSYTPVRKNSVSTLFALEAQINLWTGSPIFFA